MSRQIRLATRGSRLALAQATLVARALEASGDVSVELVLVQTTGDVRADVPLHTMGGQGVFVKEVQRCVLDGGADIAQHSAKDLPSTPADGLLIAAFTQRRSPADALVGARLADLPAGATVASGSVRRRAQLHRVRPDLQFAELRGNIDTRLAKVPSGGAIVMAVAALQLLGLTDHIAETLSVDEFVPAVGQGCVAVECRLDDARTVELLGSIDDATTRHAVEVERAFMAELGSGCSLPVGAHASDGILRTFLADPDHDRTVGDRIALTGATGDLLVASAAARAALAAVG